MYFIFAWLYILNHCVLYILNHYVLSYILHVFFALQLIVVFLLFLFLLFSVYWFLIQLLQMLKVFCCFFFLLKRFVPRAITQGPSVTIHSSVSLNVPLVFNLLFAVSWVFFVTFSFCGRAHSPAAEKWVYGR